MSDIKITQGTSTNNVEKQDITEVKIVEKGLCVFVIKEMNELQVMKYEHDEGSQDVTVDEYSVIDGKAFAESVEQRCIMDYDGWIEDIYVDSYKSNLDIFCDTLTGNKFCVGLDVFKEICKHYDVKVLWVNK